METLKQRHVLQKIRKNLIKLNSEKSESNESLRCFVPFLFTANLLTLLAFFT